MTIQQPKYLGINQYVDKIMIYSKYPRKYLIQYFGNTYIQKMYEDDENGRPTHIGYIINKEWFKLYKLEELRIKS